MLSQVIPVQTNATWLDFWFDIPELTHVSWHNDLTDDVLGALLNTDSMYAHRFMFANFSRVFGLTEEFNLQPDEVDRFWINTIVKVIEQPKLWLHHAGIVASCKPGDLMQKYGSNLSECKILSPIDLMQLVSGLQFYRRVTHLNFKDEFTAGLWLLWLALDKGQHPVWRRFRLTQNRTDILNLEELSGRQPVPESTQRNALRAWRRMAHEDITEASKYSNSVQPPNALKHSA